MEKQGCNNKKQKLTMITGLLVPLLLAQSALTLPKYNASKPLNALQSFATIQDPVLSGSQILADDEKKAIRAKRETVITCQSI